MKSKINPLRIKSTYSEAIKLVRTALLKEAGYKCERCRGELNGEYEVHHKNGCGLDWRRSNIEVLCQDCHSFKTLELVQHGNLDSRFKRLGNKTLPLPIQNLDKGVKVKQYLDFFPRR